MRCSGKTAAAVALLAILLTGCSLSGGGGSEKPSIEIGLDPYQYSKVPAYLGQHILREIGYDVTIRNADVGPLFQALARGDVDFYVDVWPEVLHRTYLERYEGDVEVIGDLYSGAPLGIGVPAYAPEGLQSIGDLNDYIDFTGGEIFALEPGAGMTETTHNTVEAYGLDYTVREGSEAAMLSEMRRAYSREEGVVWLIWRPHTMFQSYDIRILEDPLEIWGAAANSQSIGMHAGFDKEAGVEAYELFKNMEISIDEIEAWMLREDQEELDPETLAAEWVEAHPDRVKAWLGPYGEQWIP